MQTCGLYDLKANQISKTYNQFVKLFIGARKCMYTRIFAKLSNIRDDNTQKQDWEEEGRRQLFVASK